MKGKIKFPGKVSSLPAHPLKNVLGFKKQQNVDDLIDEELADSTNNKYG